MLSLEMFRQTTHEKHMRVCLSVQFITLRLDEHRTNQAEIIYYYYYYYYYYYIACPLSCASAEAYKLAQCTRPQGWGS